jgi:RNA polymerase sigma-70 factor (ECF subfamily)
LVTALSGDFEEGFSRLVREHFARAVRYCSRMLGDIGEGEEVAQAAFVKLLEKRRNLEATRESLPYLYRVLRNACVDYLRARRAQTDASLDQAAWVGKDLSKAESAEVSNALLEAIATLDEPQREVVLLRFYEGLELNEVAEATGQSMGAVAMKLTRAKAKLKERLGRLPVFAELAKGGGSA